MSHSTLTAGIASLISLSTLAFANPSQAFSITNGSFEDGDLSGWQTFGNTSVQRRVLGIEPTKGTSQALLDTAALPEDNYSSLESFLGLQGGGLDTFIQSLPIEDRVGEVEEVYGGSAIKQTFMANTGDTLSFDWNFLTQENINDIDSLNNDFAFIMSLTSSNPSLLANTRSTFLTNTSATGFANTTGFRTFSQKILTAGEYTLGIGVINVNDNYNHSRLLVDNVTLKPQINAPEAVPEPLTILGSAMALGYGALFHKKSSKQRNKSTKR